jgi:hypothetical protein
VAGEEILSGGAKKELAEALAEYGRGESTKHADLKKELGF